MNRHEILRRQYWFLNVLTANTRWLTIPFRDNHVWVFACWGGERYDDNSRYLYEYILNNYPEIKAVWVSRKKELAEQLCAKGYPAVWDQSKEGRKVMLTAGAAFYTNGLDDFSQVCLLYGAIVVHLGHAASAIKKSAFQKKAYETHTIKYYLKEAKDKLFNWYYFSYTIATSAESVRSKMLTYNIKDIHKVIMTGMPRNDIFKDYTRTPSKVLINLKNADQFRYILYMPTYRPYKNHIVEDFLNAVFKDSDFNHLLREKRFKILVKLHNSDYFSNLSNINHENIVILKSTEVTSSQELISISDVLITDYSSCCLDFALMNKPNLLYAPDYDQYCEENGIIDLWDTIYRSDRMIKDEMHLIIHISNILNCNETYMELTNWINSIYEDESIRGTIYSENVYQAISSKMEM